jgi:hypothetical protein
VTHKLCLEILPERNVRGTPLALCSDAQLEAWRCQLVDEIVSSLNQIAQQSFWDIMHDYELVEFELRARNLWPHKPLRPNEGVPVRHHPPPSLSTQGATASARLPRG